MKQDKEAHCVRCRYYVPFQGVCVNGKSEWRCDFPPMHGKCEYYEEKGGGYENKQA